MNLVVKLSLKLVKDGSTDWIVTSEIGDTQSRRPIKQRTLDRLKSNGIGRLSGDKLAKVAATVKELALGSEVKGELEQRVAFAASLGSMGQSYVRLCICPSNELRDVPWELAFASDEFASTVSVVRVQNKDLPSDDLLTGRIPTVRQLEALTKKEKDEFSSLSARLLKLDVGPVILDPTFEAATSPESAVGQCDILQLTAHGGPNGGLRLFSTGAISEATEEIHPDQISSLVNRCGADVVVVAACGSPGKGGLWSLGDKLAASGTVKAVVSMREPIESGWLATFCDHLYKELQNGEPIDTAVLRARLRLPAGWSSIPQLRLNVLGDLTLWKRPQVPVDPPAVEVTTVSSDHPMEPDFRTHAVVAIGAELWGVNLNGERIDSYQYDGDWDSGDPLEGASLAVSADGRVAAALHDDRLDLAWLVVEEGALTVKRPAWVKDLRLPEPLCGLHAKVLAVTTIHGARVRVIIATPTHTWWDLISPAHGWGEPFLLDHRGASAALDLPTDHLLVVDGRMKLPDGRPAIFAGSHHAVGADCASGAGSELAARLDKVGGRISVSHRAHTEVRWTKAAVVGTDPGALVRHVSVVRQLARGHRPSKLFVVGMDGNGTVVDTGQFRASANPSSLG